MFETDSSREDFVVVVGSVVVVAETQSNYVNNILFYRNFSILKFMF